MRRVVSVAFVVGLLSTGAAAWLPPQGQATKPGGLANSVEALAAMVCAEIWAADTPAQVESLALMMNGLRDWHAARLNDIIARRDTVKARYEAINLTVDKLEAEKEFLAGGAVPQGSLDTSAGVRDQRERANTKYWEGRGLEQRIQALEGRLAEAQQLVAGGTLLDSSGRLKPPTVPFRIAAWMRDRLLGANAGGANLGGTDLTGATGHAIQKELIKAQAEVPAFLASLGDVMGQVPAALTPGLLQLSRFIDDLDAQLIRQGQAGDVARANRLAEIVAELKRLDSERADLLKTLDEVMRAGAVADADRELWRVTSTIVSGCAGDQWTWLRDRTYPDGTIPSAPDWKGAVQGVWSSSCTHNGAALGTPAGRFTLTFDGSGRIVGAFVESATSTIDGRVDASGRLEANGSYTMTGTRLSLRLSGTVTRSPAGLLSASGSFSSNDGAGVVCTGTWKG